MLNIFCVFITPDVLFNLLKLIYLYLTLKQHKLEAAYCQLKFKLINQTIFEKPEPII